MHHYSIEDSENFGRFIMTNKTIPKDSVVMVVPPNLLLKFEEMPVCNQGLQVRTATPALCVLVLAMALSRRGWGGKSIMGACVCAKTGVLSQRLPWPLSSPCACVCPTFFARQLCVLLPRGCWACVII